MSMVMNITVFFYLLDALQGERKDRSVLFWKSMPVSDTTTVLSKLLRRWWSRASSLRRSRSQRRWS
jgi:hypothetical protein